ncbi:MAG: hypothetical protein HQ515_22680 [Phycisphaeraceae bacterium]|nr:hypothetical protein [Phycisphaeraceae bacterium]
MRKDPILACLLNLLLVGIGHIYVGQLGKGIFIMILSAAFWVCGAGLLNLVLVPWAMYDAYGVAKAVNRVALRLPGRKR